MAWTYLLSHVLRRFLNYLMMGTPASPLYKALVDSGLGSRVIGGGLDDGMLQATFSVGLKDILVWIRGSKCVCRT